eukprot:6177849-Pleurochrysis_carterae.AAC.1
MPRPLRLCALPRLPTSPSGIVTTDYPHCSGTWRGRTHPPWSDHRLPTAQRESSHPPTRRTRTHSPTSLLSPEPAPLTPVAILQRNIPLPRIGSCRETQKPMETRLQSKTEWALAACWLRSFCLG